MSKPKVADVARWDIISQGEGVIEYEATVWNTPHAMLWDFHKVTVPDARPKYFYGETAWMDSRRYADDMRNKIRFSSRQNGPLRGNPLGPSSDILVG